MTTPDGHDCGDPIHTGMTCDEFDASLKDGLAPCQRNGTCCLRCYADFGACCTHDGPPPLWVLDTSDGPR